MTLFLLLLADLARAGTSAGPGIPCLRWVSGAMSEIVVLDRKGDGSSYSADVVRAADEAFRVRGEGERRGTLALLDELGEALRGRASGADLVSHLDEIARGVHSVPSLYRKNLRALLEQARGLRGVPGDGRELAAIQEELERMARTCRTTFPRASRLADAGPSSLPEDRGAFAAMSGAGMAKLQERFDLLARKVSREPGVVHEVDAAFAARGGIPFRRLKASAGGSVQVGSHLIGEKVFASDYRGALEFRGALSHDDSRYYAVLYPKGYLERYGARVGAEVLRPGSVFPLKTPDGKAFVVHEESDTLGKLRTQVHVFPERMLKLPDGSYASAEEFLASGAVGLVEFDREGRVLRRLAFGP